MGRKPPWRCYQIAQPARRMPNCKHSIADVTLYESPFLHAQRTTEAYLLALQLDRMLHNFRVKAGGAYRVGVP